MQTNLCVYYIYRDEANYKQHSQRIFSNPTGMSSDQLMTAFLNAFRSIQSFSDVVSFDPARLGWEPLHFSAHNLMADDVSIHELGCIMETNETPATGEFIAVLMERMVNLGGPH